jgi:hypothetical protein
VTLKANQLYLLIRDKHILLIQKDMSPSFKASPQETASTITINEISSANYFNLTEAHLDKMGTLVDENEEAVGFSTR